MTDPIAESCTTKAAQSRDTVNPKLGPLTDLATSPSTADQPQEFATMLNELTSSESAMYATVVERMASSYGALGTFALFRHHNGGEAGVFIVVAPHVGAAPSLAGSLVASSRNHQDRDATASCGRSGTGAFPETPLDDNESTSPPLAALPDLIEALMDALVRSLDASSDRIIAQAKAS